jgi:lipopolysaccharide/colanic/teichoic acid biosynthesis glycosyltransferase
MDRKTWFHTCKSRPQNLLSRQRQYQLNNYRKGVFIYGTTKPTHKQCVLFRPGYQTAKRIFDVTVCVIAIPFFMLVIGIIALAIYLDDPGPIFFKQQRTGKGGRRFGMYKFRTMVKNAEELKVKYAHLNEHTWPDFKITNDPRVTKVGAFLRKTSLDELPQLFNVLKGDMSLVGPRPTSFAASTYSLWHTERLEVLPGITGLWQVSGRKELDFDDRCAWISSISTARASGLTLWILFRTVATVITRRGAE